MTTRITPNAEQGAGTGVPTGPMAKEPATVVSTVVGFIAAVIGLLVAFGIDVSSAQQGAIVAVVIAGSAVIAMVGPIIRRFVVSPASAARAADYAARTGDPVDPMRPDTWR